MSSKGFLESDRVTLDTNTSTIVLTGNVDCSYVSSGTAIFLDGGKYLVEGLSGTPADSSGISRITLRKPWKGASLQNVSMTAFNTIEGLRDAIRRAREIAEGGGGGISSQTFSDFITSTAESIDLNINGAVIKTTPYGYLLPAIENHLKKVTDGSFMDGGTF